MRVSRTLATFSGVSGREAISLSITSKIFIVSSPASVPARSREQDHCGTDRLRELLRRVLLVRGIPVREVRASVVDEVRLAGGAGDEIAELLRHLLPRGVFAEVADGEADVDRHELAGAVGGDVRG